MEYFHEYLQKMLNKFTQNIYHTKDDIYCNLRHLIQNNDIVLLNLKKKQQLYGPLFYGWGSTAPRLVPLSRRQLTFYH